MSHHESISNLLKMQIMLCHFLMESQRPPTLLENLKVLLLNLIVLFLFVFIKILTYKVVLLYLYIHIYFILINCPYYPP